MTSCDSASLPLLAVLVWLTPMPSDRDTPATTLQFSSVLRGCCCAAAAAAAGDLSRAVGGVRESATATDRLAAGELEPRRTSPSLPTGLAGFESFSSACRENVAAAEKRRVDDTADEEQLSCCRSCLAGQRLRMALFSSAYLETVSATAEGRTRLS